MAVDVYAKAREAELSMTGKRWCSQCQMTKVVEGGSWKINKNKRNRRWECGDCSERRKKRELSNTL